MKTPTAARPPTFSVAPLQSYTVLSGTAGSWPCPVRWQADASLELGHGAENVRFLRGDEKTRVDFGQAGWGEGGGWDW